MKKTARARANPSLHCKEGLKEVSMATPRSFAVSTIATGVPSAKVRGVVGGWPMGRWQHLLGLSGRSDCNLTASIRTIRLVVGNLCLFVEGRPDSNIMGLVIGSCGKLTCLHYNCMRFLKTKPHAFLRCLPDRSAGVAAEGLVENHPGGPHASWRTSGLWLTTLDLGVAIELA